MASTVALIRRWEYFAVVEEYDTHSSLIAFMNAKLDLLVLDRNTNVACAFDSSRVICEVAGLSLPITLVVWGYNSDFLAKLDKTSGELVNHNT